MERLDLLDALVSRIYFLMRPFQRVITKGILVYVRPYVRAVQVQIPFAKRPVSNYLTPDEADAFFRMSGLEGHHLP